ncbi:hypothetical protein FGO68_gene3599 [Halteria grandinella]|uniref:Protein kinase domain-containing protein n=1 Tax=Halteria grandinella TaxID=5974 RepID=A0A8J8NNU9_HALGN|nr:hypothetical protein FGO68_gene3599 [Halteria grandinella]
MEQAYSYHLIEQISYNNSQGAIYIAKNANQASDLAVVKIPKDQKDAQDLFTEFYVLEKLGYHPNIVRLIEFQQQEPCYMALEYAKGQSLISYLKQSENTMNEKWVRYFFKQIISAMEHMHDNCVAHLDMKVDNILIDFNQIQGTISALVADFGMAQPTNKRVFGKVGCFYGPPEVVIERKSIFNLEKADVFACSIILLALLTRHTLGSGEQCKSQLYQLLQKCSGKSHKLWHIYKVSPSHEFQDLFEKMICFDPQERLTFKQISGHPWMQVKDLPSEFEIAQEITRINLVSQKRVDQWKIQSHIHSMNANPQQIKKLKQIE